MTYGLVLLFVVSGFYGAYTSHLGIGLSDKRYWIGWIGLMASYAAGLMMAHK